ncbi:MAG: fructose-1,6-bisphosphatase [Eubacteriales bacterium]|nr:fructose-1,6-bisphosphatase [Eubacteriales bacterium]
MSKDQLLRVLSKEFPNRQSAMGEIIRLRALMDLPKGTEYFFSDIHGEAKAFTHLVRSASGNIRRKIRDVYRDRRSEAHQNLLAAIICGPFQTLRRLREEMSDPNFVRATILEMLEVARLIGSKYPREELRQNTPSRYLGIMEEFFYTYSGEIDRDRYYNLIVDSILESGVEEDFIIALGHMIQKICVNHIHVIGDIFDRGPAPHKVMEELIDFERVDIQWGNHDVEWLGAALGNEVCMLSVLRNAVSYNTFDALEDGYSISLRQLDDFVEAVYGDDPCERFKLRVFDENIYDIVDKKKAARMHKALAILQFKREGQLLKRHPEYEMDERIVLEACDFERGLFHADGVTYPMLDRNFPTIDPNDPLRLTAEEEDVLRSLRASFLHSETLQRHMQFLYTHGSSYLCFNGNLLFHGCIPLDEAGDFDGPVLDGAKRVGRELMEYINYAITQAYYGDPESVETQNCIDLFWYLWCGAKSPMFGKSKMATFENYFVGVKDLSVEKYNPYYRLSNQKSVCERILAEFGLTGPQSHIINGHVPVKTHLGESPMRADGKLFVIDGGIAKAYHNKTGIAGYTLIYNSHHIALAEHSNYEALSNELDSYAPNVRTVDRMPRRMRIADTDRGENYRIRIETLQDLIASYQSGRLKESDLEAFRRT